MKSNMYKSVSTWNPYKGCRFDCIYCKPSFQKQAKRQKNRCLLCYNFIPHVHPDRLNKIPSAKTVFVCGNGDISFCDPEFTKEIISVVKNHPKKEFYFQSKRPEYFSQFTFPSNSILLTTMETNRDSGYSEISKAPPPAERFKQFLELKHDRKVVTIEPILDFDSEIFLEWIQQIHPEAVYIGFNSRPRAVFLPEPEESKVEQFISELQKIGIEVRGKSLRGVVLEEKPTQNVFQQYLMSNLP